jgi:hypothetical protein
LLYDVKLVYKEAIRTISFDPQLDYTGQHVTPTIRSQLDECTGLTTDICMGTLTIDEEGYEEQWW